MIDVSFLRELDKLSLVIRKNIVSNFQGERPSKEIGEGLLFKDYSIYAPGDDIRHVDWRVYARSDKLFIKRFEEERNVTVHVLVDFSGSMAFGSGAFSKSAYASMMAIGFAYIALKNNERFVLSTFSDKLETYRPQRGRRQLATMLDQLNKRRAQGQGVFDKTVGAYRRYINSKSLVVVISDFLYPLEQIEDVLVRLRKNDVKFVQVLDPVERGLKLEGDYKLRDLETGQTLKTYVSPALRKKYLRLLSQHNDEVQKLCEETNTAWYSVDSDLPVFDAFYKILGTR